ncbi:MAG: hypothetical protein WKG01_13755 [Kofleriaceae bacterium]
MRSVVATALCLSVHGCADVDGGAVELSWKLRPTSSSDEDKFVACVSGKAGTGAVTYIRLDWEVGGVADSVAWSCSDNHGVTKFDLPAGMARLTVHPECGDHALADPASYTSPAVEQRRVSPGDTVSLGAVELVVNVSYCTTQPCICQ